MQFGPAPVTSAGIIAALGFTPSATALATIPDGTRAAPGAAFALELGVGIYRPSATHLAITTNNNAEGIANSLAVSLSEFNTLVLGAEAQAIPSGGAPGHSIGHSMEIVSTADTVKGASATRNKPGIIWVKYMNNVSQPANTQTEPDIWYVSNGTSEASPRAVNKGQKTMDLGWTNDSGTGFPPDEFFSGEIVGAASDAAGAVISLGIVPGMFNVLTLNNAGTMQTNFVVDYDGSSRFQNGLLTAKLGLAVTNAADTLLSFSDGTNATVASSNITMQAPTSVGGAVAIVMANTTAIGVSANIATIDALARNTSGTNKTWTRIRSLTNGTPTAGAENGRLQEQVAVNGTLVQGGEWQGNTANGVGQIVGSPGSLNSYGTGTTNLGASLYVNNSIALDVSRNATLNTVTVAAVTGGNVASILGSSGTASSVSSGTAETQLASITIPAGVMGANGALRITTLWSYTNSVNNKSLRVRLGGASGSIMWSSVPTTTAMLQSAVIVFNSNSASVQKAINQGVSPYTSGAGSLLSAAVNTASSTTIYISGQTASSGETITLESYTVELIPGV